MPTQKSPSGKLTHGESDLRLVAKSRQGIINLAGDRSVSSKRSDYRPPPSGPWRIRGSRGAHVDPCLLLRGHRNQTLTSAPTTPIAVRPMSVGRQLSRTNPDVYWPWSNWSYVRWKHTICPAASIPRRTRAPHTEQRGGSASSHASTAAELIDCGHHPKSRNRFGRTTADRTAWFTRVKLAQQPSDFLHRPRPEASPGSRRVYVVHFANTRRIAGQNGRDPAARIGSSGGNRVGVLVLRNSEKGPTHA